jgi:predicted ABC-type ATPase
MHQIYMIGGPNGAGKTTSAMALLPHLLPCDEYVNADAIAAGLSPFNPGPAAIQAGRLMLGRIQQLFRQRKDFAFETTMASRMFAPFLLECKQNGYAVNILFMWLKNPDLALKRVAARVQDGGHDVPEAMVRRRYDSGLKNFFRLYQPLADTWAFYDNSSEQPVLVARWTGTGPAMVVDPSTWSVIQEILT